MPGETITKTRVTLVQSFAPRELHRLVNGGHPTTAMDKDCRPATIPSSTSPIVYFSLASDAQCSLFFKYLKTIFLCFKKS
jgi:hypothetical protein